MRVNISTNAIELLKGRKDNTHSKNKVTISDKTQHSNSTVQQVKGNWSNIQKCQWEKSFTHKIKKISWQNEGRPWKQPLWQCDNLGSGRSCPGFSIRPLGSNQLLRIVFFDSDEDSFHNIWKKDMKVVTRKTERRTEWEANGEDKIIKSFNITHPERLESNT